MGLSARQKLALNQSTAKFNLWYGSVRSSKTYAQRWDFISRMADDSPVEGDRIVVGYSTNTLWRNFFQPIFQMDSYRAVAPHLHYSKNAPFGSLFGKPFTVVGASNESSAASIQGMTVQDCWWDEAELSPESFFDMLNTRLSLDRSRVLATCNPGTSAHYLKRRVVDHADAERYHVEKFLLRENPALSRQVVADLESTFTGLFYRRMILGEWVAAEGAVYQSWDEETMVEKSSQVEEILSVGVDIGTTHPSAGYALGIDSDGVLRIVSEWSPNIVEGMSGTLPLSDHQLADSFEAWLEELPQRPRYMYVDPAAKSFRQELKVRGIRTYQAANSVVSGIRTVDSLLTGGQLKIDSSCIQLIKEIPEYRWDPSASARGEDKPIKEKDDHCDAFRYAVFSCKHLWVRRVRKAKARLL